MKFKDLLESNGLTEVKAKNVSLVKAFEAMLTGDEGKWFWVPVEKGADRNGLKIEPRDAAQRFKIAFLSHAKNKALWPGITEGDVEYSSDMMKLSHVKDVPDGPGSDAMAARVTVSVANIISMKDVGEDFDGRGWADDNAPRVIIAAIRDVSPTAAGLYIRKEWFDDTMEFTVIFA